VCLGRGGTLLTHQGFLMNSQLRLFRGFVGDDKNYPVKKGTRWWQLKYFLNFHPGSLQKFSNLTNIFLKWVETTN